MLLLKNKHRIDTAAKAEAQKSVLLVAKTCTGMAVQGETHWMREWAHCASPLVSFGSGSDRGRPVVQRDWLPVIVNLSPHSAMWACVCACVAQRKGSGCVVRNFKGTNWTFAFSLVSYMRDRPLSLSRWFPPFEKLKPMTSIEKRQQSFTIMHWHEPKAKRALCEPNTWAGLDWGSIVNIFEDQKHILYINNANTKKGLMSLLKLHWIMCNAIRPAFISCTQLLKKHPWPPQGQSHI